MFARIMEMLIRSLITEARRVVDKISKKGARSRRPELFGRQKPYPFQSAMRQAVPNAEGAESLNVVMPGFRQLIAGFFVVISCATVDASDIAELSCDHPDIIKKYSCLIMQEAKGAAVEKVAPVEFYAALQALNIVQNTVSSGRYAYLQRELGNEFRDIVDAGLCLDSGYGICGHHIIVFNALMDELGIPSRRVQFLYGDGSSHIASEVKIGGKWVFFDVTWGSVYFERSDDRSSYLSLEEINRIGYENVFPLRNELSTWYFANKDTSYDTLGHMTARDRDIVIDGVGEVAVHFEWSGAAASARQFAYGFIGDNTVNGPTPGASLYWQQPAGSYRFEMASRNGGCATPSKVCLNDVCAPLTPSGVVFDFTSPGGRSVLSVRSADDICYAVPSEIRITALDK